MKSIVSNTMNSRCHVDLIDLQTQPDGEFKFILNYQDHLTKRAAVRGGLPCYRYFCMLGSPHILQSDNWREFSTNVVKEIVQMWPNCKLVHGKPRHTQSQGLVEGEQDVDDRLACWMRENNRSKWPEGLRFVQLRKFLCPLY